MYQTSERCCTHKQHRSYHIVKGVSLLSSVGYLQVHAYAANAQIPLKDVAIAFFNDEGATIALRLTNSSGQLDTPLEISVPELSAGQSPNTGITPFRNVNIYAKLTNYEEIESLNVQVFADTVTIQNLEMIPLAELPEKWNQVEIFRSTTQNL